MQFIVEFWSQTFKNLQYYLREDSLKLVFETNLNKANFRKIYPQKTNPKKSNLKNANLKKNPKL